MTIINFFCEADFNKRTSVRLSQLNFRKDESGIFKEELTDLAGKNTAMEMLKLVKYFENQFSVRTDNIDILDHDINEHVGKILKGLQEKKTC